MIREATAALIRTKYSDQMISLRRPSGGLAGGGLRGSSPALDDRGSTGLAREWFPVVPAQVRGHLGETPRRLWRPANRTPNRPSVTESKRRVKIEWFPVVPTGSRPVPGTTRERRRGVVPVVPLPYRGNHWTPLPDAPHAASLIKLSGSRRNRSPAAVSGRTPTRTRDNQESAVDEMEITLYGEPVTQGSKNAFPIYRGKAGEKEFTGKIGMVESTKAKLDPWRSAVAWTVRQAHRQSGLDVFTGAVSVGLVFAVKRGKSVTRPYPTTKPDLDKLARAVLDSVTHAGVWNDDALTVRFHILEKVYAGGPYFTEGVELEEPGMWLQLRQVPDPLPALDVPSQRRGRQRDSRSALQAAETVRLSLSDGRTRPDLPTTT